MNLQEYDQKMLVLLVKTADLEKQQKAIHRKVDEIEEEARRLWFEYMTAGDVL